MIEKRVLENIEVVDFFGGKHTLISSSVTSIRMSLFEYVLTVEVDVVLLYAKDHKKIRIRFLDVVEYAFYHRSDHSFYNVENLKFFTVDDLFYLSLDPDESSTDKLDTDNDFILSKGIQAVELEE